MVGWRIPVLKPIPDPINTMATPVIASNPNALAKRTPTGANAINLFAACVTPKSANTSVNKGTNQIPFVENFLDILVR